MKAEISIEWEGANGYLHDIEIEVSLDRDGDVWAEALENVPRKVLSGRRESYDEWLDAWEYEYRKGDPIELSPEQELEAREAVRQAAASIVQEIAQLRSLFAPLPPEETPWTNAAPVRGGKAPHSDAQPTPPRLDRLRDRQSTRLEGGGGVFAPDHEGG